MVGFNIKFVCVAAPAAQKLDLVVRKASVRSGGGAASTKAVAGVEPGVEAGLEEGGANALNKGIPLEGDTGGNFKKRRIRRS